MIDIPSLLLGAALGALLAGGIGMVLDAKRRAKPPDASDFLSLEEVQRAIQSNQIASWSEKKAETERLTGKGVA